MNRESVCIKACLYGSRNPIADVTNPCLRLYDLEGIDSINLSTRLTPAWLNCFARVIINLKFYVCYCNNAFNYRLIKFYLFNI